MKRNKVIMSAALGSIAAPAFAQPGDIWTLLDQISIDEIVAETTYEVRKSFPPALQAGEIEMEISGYATPMYPGDEIRELILVSDMGLCPLCGSADHGSSLQVSLVDPLPFIDESTRIKLRGTLSPVLDPETWQAAILQDARVLSN